MELYNFATISTFKWKNKTLEKKILQNENCENLSTLYKPNIHLISLNDTDRAILICDTANSIKNISKKGLDSQICKKSKVPLP